MKLVYNALLCVSVLAAHAHTAHTPPERHLKAARLRLAKRSANIELQRNFDLHYVDDQAWRPDAMSAKMEVQSHAHSLVLEDIEHLVDEIHCTSDAKLFLRFRPDHFASACDAISEAPKLFIVTSHAGCNEPGTRMPYIVKDLDYIKGDHTIKISLGDASWKKDFGMKVRFGPADRGTYSLNRHDHLAPRSLKRGLGDLLDPSASPSVSRVEVSASSTIPSASQLVFPTPTGNVSSNTTSITDSVAFQLQNTKILPPSIDNITVGIPLHNTGLAISCIDCSTTGSMSMASGYFSSGSNSSEHFFQDGFVELAANGVGAHIALDVNWLASAGQGLPFNITLPKIPLTPFTIPGVADVGATFIPQLIFAATVTADMDFQYGFDVKVPDNSTAVASFGDAGNSSVTGFENTTVTALPFNSKVNNVSLTLSATLQPQILLGLTVLEEKAGAAVFLNMPQLSISVTDVTGTNDRCEPINDTQNANELLGNLTHIVPKVEIAAGFVIEASGVGQTAYTPFATTFGLETACLAFNTKGSSYGPATAAFASATASAASASAAKSSSAAHQLRPRVDGGVVETAGSWQWAIVALAIVFGGFITL